MFDIDLGFVILGAVVLIFILILWFTGPMGFMSNTIHATLYANKTNLQHQRFYQSWVDLSRNIRKKKSLSPHIKMKIILKDNIAHPIITRYSGGTRINYTLLYPQDFNFNNIAAFVLHGFVPPPPPQHLPGIWHNNTQPVSLQDLTTLPKPT